MTFVEATALLLACFGIGYAVGVQVRTIRDSLQAI